MPEVKLMTPLFDGGMYNRTGRRMRAVFIKEVADGTTTYRLWRKDGKPEIEYPRCDNDRYILHVEVNSYLIPLRMTEFQMIDNCGYRKADALRMLTSYAFGIEDLDAVSDEDRAEYEKEFETSYGITFEEAKESIPEIVSYFFQKTDCNVGENTTWYEAIEAVFGGNRDGD